MDIQLWYPYIAISIGSLMFLIAIWGAIRGTHPFKFSTLVLIMIIAFATFTSTLWSKIVLKSPSWELSFYRDISIEQSHLLIQVTEALEKKVSSEKVSSELKEIRDTLTKLSLALGNVPSQQDGRQKSEQIAKQLTETASKIAPLVWPEPPRGLGIK